MAGSTIRLRFSAKSSAVPVGLAISLNNSEDKPADAAARRAATISGTISKLILKTPRAASRKKFPLTSSTLAPTATDAARLPVRPSSLAQLESRLGIPQVELRARLEPMCEKGVVMDVVHPRTGEVRYLLSPPVVGFLEFSMMRAHDSIPKKRMAEALEAYTHGDPAFAREAFGGETVIGRAVAVTETPGTDAVADWARHDDRSSANQIGRFTN